MVFEELAEEDNYEQMLMLKIILINMCFSKLTGSFLPSNGVINVFFRRGGATGNGG